jgi:hypothetical protein
MQNLISEKKMLYLQNILIKQDNLGSYVKIDIKQKKIYIKTGIESEENTEVIGDVKEGLVVYD